MELILFGTGAPPPRVDKNGPSNGICVNEKLYLVDAARNVTQQIVKAGFKVGEIDQLFFTHFHSDHYSGFGDFYISRWLGGAAKPLQVWGPAPVESIIRKMLDYYEYDVELRIAEGVTRLGTGVEVNVLAPGDTFVVDGMNIHVDKGTRHGNVDDILSYRFDAEGRSVVIASDGSPTDKLAPLAKGANLLLAHFCVPHIYEKYGTTRPFTPFVIAHHASAEEVADAAKEAGVERLAFSHIVPPMTSNQEALEELSKFYQGEILAGEDLMRIKV